MGSIKSAFRSLLRHSGGFAVGIVVALAARPLFWPGAPLAAWSENVWVRLLVVVVPATGLAIVLPRCWAALKLRWSMAWELREWLRDANFPTWVALRHLGESNAVKLTALAPVLGSLILLNDEAAKLFSSTLLDSHAYETSKPLLGFIHIPRLHLIYLGLSLLGVGALCFSSRCPDVIQRYPSPEAWLLGEDRMLSGGRLRGEFSKVIETYIANSQPDPQDPDAPDDAPVNYERTRNRGYSSERYQQLHLLIHEIVELKDPAVGEVDWEPRPSPILGPDGVPANFVPDPETVYDNEYFGRFRIGIHDMINTDAWIEVLWSGRRFEAYLRETLFATAVASFKERIVYLRFQDLSYERPAARAVITAIYGLGIIALAVPTLHTFVVILKSAFK